MLRRLTASISTQLLTIRPPSQNSRVSFQQRIHQSPLGRRSPTPRTQSDQLSTATRRSPDFPSNSDLVLAFLAAALVFHALFTHGWSVNLTEGISMLPTFPSYGGWVIVSRYYRRGRDVAVGDVVSFKHPLDADMRALKRVVGLGGDFVVRDSPHVAASALRGGGEGGEEDREQGSRSPAMIQVPKGHVYVVGDNLDHSRDSRMFGPIPLALIRGKVKWTLNPWPKRVSDGLVEISE